MLESFVRGEKRQRVGSAAVSAFVAGIELDSDEENSDMGDRITDFRDNVEDEEEEGME